LLCLTVTVTVHFLQVWVMDRYQVIESRISDGGQSESSFYYTVSLITYGIGTDFALFFFSNH
jgi:hypothetical protein